MFSEEFEEIPQSENFETFTWANRTKRQRQRSCELPNQQNLTTNESVIELESNTDANTQQKTVRNSKRHKKTSTKFDLNKISDRLILIPNAKPPGQSWICDYFDQYE